MKQRSSRRSTRRMRSRRRSVKRTNRTARRMRSRRRSTRRMRSRRSTRRSRRSRRTRRSRRRLLKGGGDIQESLLDSDQQYRKSIAAGAAMSADSQDPVETQRTLETQVNDIFKSDGFMLTKNALAKGMIADAEGKTEKGQLVYSALSYAAYLYGGSQPNDTLSGKYLLFAIHTMHKMRTHGTQMSRLAAKAIIAALLGFGEPLGILGGAIIWFQHKLGVKLTKRFFEGIRRKGWGINWTAKFARSYFNDLQKKSKKGEHRGRDLFQELLTNGYEIQSAINMMGPEGRIPLTQAYETVDQDFKQNMATASWLRKKSGSNLF